MALALKQYIELHGDDPTQARVAGSGRKAYIMALHAIDDVNWAVENFDNFTHAQAHAALAFYYEHYDEIHKRLEEHDEEFKYLREASDAHVADMRERLAKMRAAESNDDNADG